jgi:hypothetical protein
VKSNERVVTYRGSAEVGVERERGCEAEAKRGTERKENTTKRKEKREKRKEKQHRGQEAKCG